MTTDIVTLTASDGCTVRFINEVKAQGGVKDVMFSPDGDYVVAFFRDKAEPAARDRLLEITGRYREKIFNQEGGEYLKKLYCWPTSVVEHDGRVLVDGQRSIKEPHLWLAGYGDWCGPGSATLMGAARTARDLAARMTADMPAASAT